MNNPEVFMEVFEKANRVQFDKISMLKSELNTKFAKLKPGELSRLGSSIAVVEDDKSLTPDGS